MTVLKPPSSVRTPGRTWTEFPAEIGEAGEGKVEVDAPEEVEVRQAKIEEIFQQSVEENSVTERHSDLLDMGDTVSVRIPEGTVVEEPVSIETEIEAGFFPHHVIVEVGKGSSARVVERNRGEGEMDSSITEVRVGEDAILEYEKVNDIGETTGYSDMHARVEENGEIDWLVVSAGADMYRNAVESELAGPRSRLDYRLAFLASGEQHMDHSSKVVHAADSTRCDMDSRGVALDSSRTVYKGVQEVEEDAERTKSFQEEKTVLVGENAEADTTPQLRIDNHDVEATHAATTGHVDEQDLFYMKSRGLKEEKAKQEIIKGMFDDLLESKEASKVIRRKIRETLG